MPVKAGDLEFLATLRDEVSAKLKGINENIEKHREKYVAGRGGHHGFLGDRRA